MYSINRDSPRNNVSGILDKSNKSIITSSTYTTPKRNNINSLFSFSVDKKRAFNKDRIIKELKNINLTNDISKMRNNNYNKLEFMNYLHTEPNKQSNDLIYGADKILKERRNNHLMMNELVKSVFMKKTDQIRLDNYKIKVLKNKRNQLNEQLSEINKAYKMTEKILDKDYQNFISFVEENNKTKKNQENLLNLFKKITNEKEKEFNKLNEQNKKLKNKIENIVKQILTLKSYGSFIHKVFNKDFIYENIKKTEDKNYSDISDDIIQIYEKNGEKEFDDKLLEENLLITNFKESEDNLIKIINEKDSYRKDFLKIEYFDKVEMNKLIKKKEELEKQLEMLKNDRDLFVKSIRKYDSPENMDTVLDCIAELAETLEINNPSTSILLKDKNENNYTIICSNLIKIIKEKELKINIQINEIENILNGENTDDRQLIEEFILERKKEIKKNKLISLIAEKNEETRKKNAKAVERAHRIVVKGRKVIEFPFIKPKKKKKVVITENNDDDCIFYSSEEENK